MENKELKEKIYQSLLKISPQINECKTMEEKKKLFIELHSKDMEEILKRVL